MSMDTKVTVCGVEFANPVIAASGTFGMGAEYEKFYDLSRIGGISSKGLTLEPRLGNPSPHRGDPFRHSQQRGTSKSRHRAFSRA